MLKNSIKRACLLTGVIIFASPVSLCFSKEGDDIWKAAAVHEVKAKTKSFWQDSEDNGSGKTEPAAYKKEDPSSMAVTGTPAPASAGYVFVIDQNLSQVLKEFGRSSGMAVEVDPDIRVQVVNQKIPLEPNQFIDFVTSRYEVTVAREEKSLRFSPVSPAVSRMFMLNKVPLDRLIKSALAAGLDIKKYSMRVIPDNNAIVLNAPAPVLGRVAALIESLAASANANVTIIRFGRVEESGNTHNGNAHNTNGSK